MLSCESHLLWVIEHLLSEIFQWEQGKKKTKRKSSHFHETVNLDLHKRVNEQKRESLWTKSQERMTNNLSLAAVLFIVVECHFRLRSMAAVCCPLLATQTEAALVCTLYASNLYHMAQDIIQLIGPWIHKSHPTFAPGFSLLKLMWHKKNINCKPLNGGCRMLCRL